MSPSAGMAQVERRD